MCTILKYIYDQWIVHLNCQFLSNADYVNVLNVTI